MAKVTEQDTGAEVSVWKVAPGDHAFMWEESLASGCITINRMNKRNLDQFKTQAEIALALSKLKDGHGGAPYIWRFVKEIKPGHVIVANDGQSRVGDRWYSRFEVAR